MKEKYDKGVVTVNPRGTTYSEDHEYVMRKHDLDRLPTLTYLIAVKARRSL